MGKFKLNGEEIENYNIEVRNESIENMPFSIVFLTIQTNSNSYEYRILCDTQFPKIEMITSILEEGLKRAKLNIDDDFNIAEDPEKRFLSVSYLPEGEFQFQGKRVN